MKFGVKGSQEYHDSIIKLVSENESYLASNLDFELFKVRTNVIFNYGVDKICEVDVYVLGKGGEKAIIEVKSHRKLANKFYKYQLPVFRNNFPDAEIGLIYSNNVGSLKLSDLEFKLIEDLRGPLIYY